MCEVGRAEGEAMSECWNLWGMGGLIVKGDQAGTLSEKGCCVGAPGRLTRSVRRGIWTGVVYGEPVRSRAWHSGTG